MFELKYEVSVKFKIVYPNVWTKQLNPINK
jgi:hypothetical protein